MTSLKTRGLDGVLRVHVEIEGGYQDLSQRLVLIVTAGSGERGGGLAVGKPRDDGRAESDARALAARELVGIAGHQHELLSALGERNSRIPGDDAWQPSARRRRRKHHS